jgi:uncharacterized radical SAM superfamily protein
MQSLKTSANIAKPDDLYELLIGAHNGLTKAESDSLNAKLILILMNHIGDDATIREALELAKTRVQIKSKAS